MLATISKQLCIAFFSPCIALTMKSQNIGSSTKKEYEQIFDSGKLDSNKWKYMSLGLFKSHAYCSIAKNGREVVYQN